MKHNISKSTWKKDLYLLIIELYEVKENETWNDWMSRINNLLLNISKKYGLSHKSFNRKLSKDSNKGLVKRNQKLTQEDLWCKNVSRIDIHTLIVLYSKQYSIDPWSNGQKLLRQEMTYTYAKVLLKRKEFIMATITMAKQNGSSVSVKYGNSTMNLSGTLIGFIANAVFI